MSEFRGSDFFEIVFTPPTISSRSVLTLQTDDPDDRQGAIRLFWRKLLRQGGAQ